MSLPLAIICDIDGTIALSTSGRSPFDWHRVGEDTLNEPVASLLEMIEVAREAPHLGQDLKLIMLSGRDKVCEPETIEWLIDNNIGYDELYMRSKGDFRPDQIVKRELFDRYIKDKYEVMFVLDDRNKVVKMWREDLGLTCLQVAQGDF